MNRYNKRQAVILFRQNTTEMRVPGVAMHEIRIDFRGVEVGAAPDRPKN